MSNSRAGFEQIVSCDKDTLLTTPVDPIALGIRGDTPMDKAPYGEIKDYLNRQWRNGQLYTIKGESLQPSMFMIKKSVGWLNQNCDLQVISNKQALGASGDCYQFAGAGKRVGLEFEYLMNADKRSLTPTWELAMRFADAKTFDDGADSATAVTFTGITGAGEDQTKLKRPYLLAFEFPKATPEFVSNDDFEDISFSMKATGTKSKLTSVANVNYLTFEISPVFKDASLAKEVEIMAKDNAPSVYIKMGNEGAYFDAFDFNAGVLTLSKNYKNDNSVRNMPLKFTGSIFVYDVDFQFGATYGEDATHTTGEVGGTMKIGY